MAAVAIALLAACADPAGSARSAATASLPQPSAAGTTVGVAGAASPSSSGIPVSAAAPPVSGSPALMPTAATSPLAGNFAEPPPVRTGVQFDWEETDPDQTVPCNPGRYVGEYNCRLYIIATEGDGAFDVVGTVDMLLEPSTQGEFLRVRNGKFSSATLAAIPVEGDIVGELDCSKRTFEGRLENGTFSVALGLPVPFTQGTFAGPLTGDYDPTTAGLRGPWNMSGELDGFPGSCVDGAWSATRAE